jgi:hypothetical protein
MMLSTHGHGLSGGVGAVSMTWPTSVPDSSTCGINPCTWSDNVFDFSVSDACKAFLQCADPNNVSITATDQGVMAASGQAAGAAVGGAIGGAVNESIKSTYEQLNIGTMLAIGAAAVVAFMVLKK